ncbi:DUF2577 family protein [Clostridium sp. Mt-5]|uniref:DUF2577 family protein n=1 Tax=Clostridium moutaii TaxID=3240932 RepID=A0ABV4BV50_9CLOT
MSRWHTKIAAELKKRDNQDYIGAIIGTVVQESPLIISIYNGQGVFLGDKLYVCKNCTEYTMQVTTSQGNGTAKHEGLKEGDKVACIATEDNQKLFVIDKL